MSLPYSPATYNLASTTKWMLIMPWQKIVPDASDEYVSLNLTNFEMPQIGTVRADFNVRGTPIPIQLDVSNDTSKQLTFNYLLSSDWHQYQIIYKWYRMISREWGGGTDYNQAELSMDLSVVLLSEYKNTMFQIDYKNCKLETIAGISMNLQDDENVINHAFTINYSHYEIKGLVEGIC